jgi:hypothetical protein
MPPISTAKGQARCGCRVFRAEPFVCEVACREDTVAGFSESSVLSAIATPCIQTTAHCKYLVLISLLANVLDTRTQPEY